MESAPAGIIRVARARHFVRRPSGTAVKRAVGFGIDLGTGYARAAMLAGRTPELVRVLDGAAAIPMVLALDPSGVKVGAAAVAEAAIQPAIVARSFLPLLGKSFDHPALRSCAHHTNAPMLRRPDGGVSLSIGDRARDPAELVTMFLQHLMGLVERQFSRRPTGAVFAVPPWFDADGREALTRAAEKADIKVEKMICDGQAMAFMQATDAERNMTVVDVGARGVGVTVLSASRRKIVLKAGSFQARGGGDDVDRALLDMCLADLGRHGTAIADKHGIIELLRQAIEAMKRDLCDAQLDVASHPFHHVPVEIVLHRARLERLLENTAAAITEGCKRSLAEADASVADTECVFVNGGMARLPSVRARIGEIFKPFASPLPLKEGAAAIGAAMYSAALQEKPPIMRDLRPPDAAEVRVATTRSSGHVQAPQPVVLRIEERDDRRRSSASMMAAAGGPPASGKSSQTATPTVPAPPVSSSAVPQTAQPTATTDGSASSVPPSSTEGSRRAYSPMITPAAIQAAMRAPRMSGMISRSPPPVPGLKTPASTPAASGTIAPWTVNPSGVHATPPGTVQPASAPPSSSSFGTSAPAPPSSNLGSAPPSSSAHAAISSAPPSSSAHAAISSAPPSSSAHAAISSAPPASSAHAAISSAPPSSSAHAAIGSAPPPSRSGAAAGPSSSAEHHAAPTSHPWSPSARAAPEPVRKNLLEEMSQGRFTRPDSAAAMVNLACARPLVAADLKPLCLPVLLVRLIGNARATGTLTLEGGQNTTLDARIEEGRAILSVREHNTLIEAFSWTEGFYRFEPGHIGKLVSKGPKPVPLTQLTVEGLRVLIRTFEADDIERAIANRLHLAPIIALGREGLVSRMGLTGLEARMAENNLDGFTSGMALIDHGRLGRQTTLGLLVILTVFDAIDWINVKHVPKASLEEELTSRAIKLDGQNHFLALGVHWSTLTEDIEAAYKALCKEFAPRPGASPEVQALLARINKRLFKAHEVLKDPHQRRVYRRETYQLDY